MRPRLDALAAKYEEIGDVRGRGAMLAVEFADRDPAQAAAVAAACHRAGLIVLTAGTYGNVLRFLPPLVIGEDLLNEGIDILQLALEEVL